MVRHPIERSAEPKFPEHPKREHTNRVTRLRELMEEDGLDAVVLGRNIHVFHLSGSRFVFVSWEGPNAISPQTTVIITPDEDIYCQRYGPFDSEDVPIHTAHNETIECYDDETELVNILDDYGISSGDRIGTEWGREGLTNFINPLKFQDIKTEIESELGAEIVNANPTMWKLMGVKSDLEVDRMRTAVNAAGDAMNRIFEEIEVGMNQLEVSQRVKELMLEAGADDPSHAQVMANTGNINLRSCLPVDHPIKEGWVSFDIGAYYKRYRSDINRGAFIGREPTEDERKLHRVRAGINRVLDETIAPGVPFDDAIEAVQNYVDEEGVILKKNHGTPWLGHNIGLENYNPPNLVPSEHQPEFQNEEGQVLFQPGMMFTYEMPVDLPGVETPFFNVEDDIVVTDSGVEVMNDQVGRELRVIP